MGWPYLAQWPGLPVAFYTFKKKKQTNILCQVLVQCVFFTLCLRVNFRTLSTLWVLCRCEREEVEDCCCSCTKRKHARLSVCAIVLKWEHQCRGTNVELFAYNDYVQLNPPHDSWNMGQPQHSTFCCFKDIIISELWFWLKPFLWLHGRLQISRLVYLWHKFLCPLWYL